jgi:hypothetical protein
MALLSIGNAKTTKGEKKGYLTGIVYMAPANNVKGINVCKFASKGCKLACLYSAGRGKFSNVQQARIKRTELFRDNQELFMQTLKTEITKFIKKAERKGLTPVVRLNGTSDISYENILVDGKTIFEHFPTTQFYDYTKNYTRFNSAEYNRLNNYHLTFSRSDSKVNQTKSIELLGTGVNVAMVFNNVPETHRGFKVINGDETDLRFLDSPGVIVGLTAKGDAKKDSTGFVL